MSPWALGFKGNMVLAESGTYITQGAYEIENDDCVRITELPLYRWTEEYKKFLDNNSHVRSSTCFTYPLPAAPAAIRLNDDDAPMSCSPGIHP